MRLLLLLAFSCWCFQKVQAQDDSATVVPQAKDTTHSIKKAILFSAVLPGSGQIYNHLAMPKGKKKAYWKVPLIYAGLGATGYFLFRNNTLKNDLRTEYESRQAGNVASEQFEIYDDAGLLQLYSIHRQRRDLFILALGFVYLLNVADAGVEAHFVSFDVSENLSLSVEPVLMENYRLGVGIRLNFR
ncbi:MAG: DUF5683 domain-containing protein [Fluviicola sp.]|nr:DUF5683 domain-containing protein [Fluviicola sp.]